MSTLEEHARDIRRAVAALHEHAKQAEGRFNRESVRSYAAAFALEDAIMRTLPVIGMDPVAPSDAPNYYGDCATCGAAISGGQDSDGAHCDDCQPLDDDAPCLTHGAGFPPLDKSDA